MYTCSLLSDKCVLSMCVHIYAVMFYSSMHVCSYICVYNSFVRMLDTLQYIIMIILPMFIVIYVFFLYLNDAHHTLQTLTICMSHCFIYCIHCSIILRDCVKLLVKVDWRMSRDIFKMEWTLMREIR